MIEIWPDFVKIIITTKDERIKNFFPENQIIENILKIDDSSLVGNNIEFKIDKLVEEPKKIFLLLKWLVAFN
jgi:hypothetical protein